MPENKEPKILHKSFSFEIKEIKEIDRDGQKFGIIKGYASTYGTVDRGNEMIVKGAFTKSLERHRATNRPIRMYYQHNRELLMGGFPIDKVKDDEKGLYVEGEINLAVPEGKSAYALAKQGVLTDLSIGYSEIETEQEKGIYLLQELELWEISPVGEPMNSNANILEVKRKGLVAHVTKYYKKMGLESPLKNAEIEEHYKLFAEFLKQEDEAKEHIDLENVSTIKEIENFLKINCGLSSSIRKTLISKIKSFSRDAKYDDFGKEQRDVCSNLAEQLSDYQIKKKLNNINDLLRGKKNVK